MGGLTFLGNRVLESWVEQISTSSTSGGVVVLVTSHKHSLSFVKWTHPEMVCPLSALDLVQSLMPMSGCEDVSLHCCKGLQQLVS